MDRYIRTLLLVVLLFAFDSNLPHALDSVKPAKDIQPLEIIKITPTGEDVPAGRQITFQFNGPVVPVGRMERKPEEIPIAITPELNGQWRWLNTDTLALMLGEGSALKPATRYDITVNPGIRAEDGATLKKPVKHSFITERPKVIGTDFKIWESPGMPVIRVSFNQPVSKDSVERHLYLRTNKQVASRVRLIAQPDPDQREIPPILPLPGDNLALVTSAGQSIPSETTMEKGAKSNEIKVSKVWLVSPENDLPEDTAIEYFIEPGLESVFGPEKGVEDRVIDSLKTFKAFSFLGIQCRDIRNNKCLITSEDDKCRCNPEELIYLVFSAPVIRKTVLENITIVPEPESVTINPNDWRYRDWNIGDALKKKAPELYLITLPFKFEPNRKYTFKGGSNYISDAFGRVLSASVDFSIVTDHLPPHYDHAWATVLEKDMDTDMPVKVRNLDSLTFNYDRFRASGIEKNLEFKVLAPEIKDRQMVIPAGIRSMLENESGVVYGEIKTSPDTSMDYNRPVIYFAQVTPFHVHLKQSYSGTLVWVTDLKTGDPVSGAQVEIYRDKYRMLELGGEILSQGITDLQGLVTLAGTGELNSGLTSEEEESFSSLFVRVNRGSDVALIPDDYSFSVYNPLKSSMRNQGISAWGTTAQGVYRPGDTVQYKIYVRDQDSRAFIPAPKKGYKITIMDSSMKSVFIAKDLELTEFGALQGEFHLSETCASGFYKIILSSPLIKDPYFSPVGFLVADFRPSPFEVKTHINGEYFHSGDKLKVDTSALSHTGEAYGDAEARVTLSIIKISSSRYFFPDSSLADPYYFDAIEMKPERESKVILSQKESVLDMNGNLVTVFDLEDDTLFGVLEIESSVRDSRGKYVAGRVMAKYSSRDLFIGLSHIYRACHIDKACNVEMLAANIMGNAAAGVQVAVTVEHMKETSQQTSVKTHEKGPQYTERWETLEKVIIESQEAPFEFSFIPSEKGDYRITASITDSRGKGHSSSIIRSVSEKLPKQKRIGDFFNLEIISEKAGYRVGDIARYTVQNPFPGAKALITIERNGIIKHWVQKLDSEEPIIEFKIEEDFAPEFYISVVVMSPRTDKPVVDNIDTGEPTFRMGYVKTDVNDPVKELIVQAEPVEKNYKPGDMIKIDLQVNSSHGLNDETVELAVVVLNEEVLSLLSEGIDYFDPYKGFYSEFGLGVKNFNLLTSLVGKEYFQISDSLGIPLGAAFGVNSQNIDIRSVFKSVTYWNPSIIADKDGKASIEFEAPDNLTGWRVLAMAVTPTDQMGLGEGRFSVTRDTEIRPVMPNQVTEGDGFEAGFSVMNRTEKVRELTVTVTAQGAIETDPGQETRQTRQTIAAEPYKRTTVWLPLKTKGSGKILFTAKGGDESDQDGLVHELDVRKMTSLETSATYGTSIEKTVTESIQFPEGIRTDTGKVKVSLSPSVIGNVEGAFKYLRDYPYTCWEQLLTKAVMASHYRNLKRYMPDDFEWEGYKDLPQSILDRAANYQAPNGGMAYYRPDDQYANPYLSAYTALAFNRLSKSGYEIPENVKDRLYGYLIKMLREDKTPETYSSGMASTVRAVALAAMAEQGRATIDDIMRYYPHVKEMDLFGKAHFLMAAVMLKGTDDMQKNVLNMILSHADQTGGKFVFNEVFDDGYSRILTSSLRTNAAVLSSLVAYSRTETGKKLADDIPFKLVRYITQTRKQSGRWENTQENIFCMNALIDYSRTYESESPDMAITAMLDMKIMGKARFTDVRDKAVDLTRPIQSNDPGRKTAVTIEREGEGRLYYSVGLNYAPLKLNTESINAGIDIRREYAVERNGEWVLLESPMEIKRGELVRVDLFVSLPAARNFVVVDDPVPGGLEPVNTDLATSSVVDAQKGEYRPAGGSWWFHYGDWSYYGMSRWSFYHRELRHHAVRFYSEYLSAGNYHLSYTAQAIAPGEFVVIPAHAEEMYDPDVFGKSGAGVLNVRMEGG